MTSFAPEQFFFVIMGLELCSIKCKNKSIGWKICVQTSLRYHGRWIDSIWKSRSYASALKENPINLYIF